MSQCLNPDCLQINPEKTLFCQKCGSKLLLVDRYRTFRILGQGGFGRTFLAVDEFKPSKPYCVVKQFLPSVKGKKTLEKAAELFQREAMRLDELGKHERIPELLAFFNQEEHQYLIQEFIDGDDLKKELEINGVFNEQQIRELLDDMLSILQFVHQNGVIHRDIKPENIIRRKQDGRLVLVDFGAAKERDENSSATGTRIGSAAYIAPEQAVGKAKFASDLYSLGATCLHLLTNIEPTELFDMAEGEWMWREYLGNNEISYELSRILDKLVEGATKRRFQSVKEVLEELDRHFSKSTVSRNIQERNLPSSTTSKPNLSSTKPLNLKIIEFNFVTVATNNYSFTIHSHKKSALQIIHHQGKAKYLTCDLGGEITLDLIGIPGGKLMMGSPENELERGNDESPQHLVQIRPFLMGKYPVTQAQWQAVMKNNPSRFQEGNRSQNDNKPVERVSWYDCWEFCQKLSALIGREFRLPSEAEWEYACRARTTTPFHFGATISTELANYNGEYAYDCGVEGEYRGGTTKVGSFSPNSLGLYDLHGNVAEWCIDTKHDRYDNAPVDGSAWAEERSKVPRILRGGSWLHLPSGCRCANRLSSPPGSKSDAFGFRIASSV
jgi:formylglycine-generating enzyme required for sulfatase activity